MMLFKGKNKDIEICFGGCVDLSFWALPCSLCFMKFNNVGPLTTQIEIIFRVFCFQVSCDIWLWDKEVTDVENSIEDLFREPEDER